MEPEMFVGVVAAVGLLVCTFLMLINHIRHVRRLKAVWHDLLSVQRALAEGNLSYDVVVAHARTDVLRALSRQASSTSTETELFKEAEFKLCELMTSELYG